MKISLVDQFICAITEIKEPELFLGVARVLKVKLVEGDEVRAAEDIIGEVIQAYAGLNRKRKKELLGIVREAIKQKV